MPPSQSIKILKTPLSDAKGLVDKKTLNSETVRCQSSMDAMKADLKAVDKKIKELINQDPVLKELFDIVDSVKGIGPVIATEVLITTNEFKAAGDPDITDPKNMFAGGVPLIAVLLPLNIHQVNTKESLKLVIKPIKK